MFSDAPLSVLREIRCAMPESRESTFIRHEGFNLRSGRHAVIMGDQHTGKMRTMGGRAVARPYLPGEAVWPG